MHPLRQMIPAARIARYDAACTGTGVDGVDVYRWASSVALAVFGDLATLEVAMRSSMARELANSYGEVWYQRADLLDDEALRLIRDAFRVGRLQSLHATPSVVHGKLVATLMFGFWVKLLGRGTYQGQGAMRRRRIYDTTIWKPALRHAFPHVGDLDRALVESAARRVQSLRNRIAHHEHIVWGVPLAGERPNGGVPTRLSVSDSVETVFRLSGYVDSDLGAWLRLNSTVSARISECPVNVANFKL